MTQTAYSFWLYDLCDNYLELIKPVVGDRSPDNAKVCPVPFVILISKSRGRGCRGGGCMISPNLW